ncbi:hypothetical protein HJC23_003449 [Cyclotella cryptica]|uniref:Uncharacterized protein n=1 Tax=Cyclotella cryptica TaxID=29204 RepID=A0ABD3QT08_9STRA
MHLPVGANDEYPPEIIVLLSSKISSDVTIKTRLHPFFCDRVLPVQHIPINRNANRCAQSESHVREWDENCGWTKLRIFELESYDTVLYIDADCLVVKDISHLLHIDTTASKSDKSTETTKRFGLLAAAPDIFPPDKFNAGVMVIRPSKSIFDDMMSRLPFCDTSNRDSNNEIKHCKSYDGGDTGFLNSYYPNWYKDMPPYSRLSFGFNAQRFMHHCTFDKQPNYWNDGIDDLRIIHFSSSPKPWDTSPDTMKISRGVTTASELLAVEEGDQIKQSCRALESLWQTVFAQSQCYYEKELKKRQATKASSTRTLRAADTPPAKDKFSPHQMMHKRYKELRRKGYSTSQAMEKARTEYGMNQEFDPCRAVGQMFGL